MFPFKKKDNHLLSLNQAYQEKIEHMSEQLTHLEERLYHEKEDNRNLSKQLSFYSSLNNQILNTVSPIQSIRNTLSDITENMKHFLEAYEKDTRDGITILSHFCEIILAIVEKNESIFTLIDALRHNAKNISTFSTTIDKVSNQTNLLALNAAIESARAGQFGKGFSVVSEEVRLLATSSGESAKKIKTIIDEINLNIDFSYKKITHIKEDVKQLQGQLTEIIDIITTLIHNSNNLYKVVNNNYYLTFLKLVQLDHIQWKISIYQRIRNKEYGTKDITDHTNCRLGKWYYEGHGKLNFSALPSYLKLDKYHKDVHSYGRDALIELEKNNIETANSFLALMESSADHVIELLDNIGEEITKNNDVTT